MTELFLYCEYRFLKYLCTLMRIRGKYIMKGLLYSCSSSGCFPFLSVSVTNINQGRKFTLKNGFIFLTDIYWEKKVEGV